jgi:hypothetical protein
MASDTTRNEILARFPGPVTLYPSRRRWLLIMAGCSLFAVGIWVTGKGDWTSWLAVAFFAIGAIMSGIMMLHGAAALTLDAQGFEMINLYRANRWQWQDASGFEAETLPRSWQKFVAFDNAKMQNSTWTRINHALFSKHNAALGDNYGLSAVDLAKLMTRWRDLAIAARRN